MSRRTTVTLGNGTTTGYGYTTQSALASLTQNLAGTAQDNTWSYTRNQVQDIKAASWTNDSYQWSGYSNCTRSYTTNPLNQYATAAGSTLSYDANGNPVAAQVAFGVAIDAPSANQFNLTPLIP